MISTEQQQQQLLCCPSAPTRDTHTHACRVATPCKEAAPHTLHYGFLLPLLLLASPHTPHTLHTHTHFLLPLLLYQPPPPHTHTPPTHPQEAGSRAIEADEQQQVLAALKLYGTALEIIQEGLTLQVSVLRCAVVCRQTR
jgi:hypothetical protein